MTVRKAHRVRVGLLRLHLILPPPQPFGLQGLFVPKNTTRARELFEVAADMGLAAGHNGLGVLHYGGQGVEQNLTAAFEAFTRGARMNDADSMYNIGAAGSRGRAGPPASCCAKLHLRALCLQCPCLAPADSSY